MALYRYDSYLGPHLNMSCTLTIQKGHHAHRAQATINNNSATKLFVWDLPSSFSKRLIATLSTKFGEIQKATIARDKFCGLLRHSESQGPGRYSHTAATGMVRVTVKRSSLCEKNWFKKTLPRANSIKNAYSRDVILAAIRTLFALEPL